MSSQILKMIHLLALLPILGLAQDIVERSHPRDMTVKKRATVDCGTWTMKCAGVDGGAHIEDACNNACYFVKVLNGGSYTATYSPSADTSKNRRQSGCNISSQDHSVCTWMPASQRFGDQLSDPTCDEFPLADWVQPDFGSTQGPRNALRCMERSANSGAGAQWNNFRDGVGSALDGRTCQGPMNDPDTTYTFNIAFNTDNAYASSVQYCEVDNPANVLDYSEFYLTSLANPPNGANHFPLQSTDNMYDIASGTTHKTLEQCKAVVTRSSGDSYDGALYDMDGNQLASAAKELTDNSIYLKVDPNDASKSLGMLLVYRTDTMGDAGTPGSKVQFYFRTYESLDESNPLVDFEWTTDSTGRDTRFVSDGHYCDVPNISENEDGDSQTITCYFPCPHP